MGDVLEYLVDGTSGIAPGGVEGSALVVGICSKGDVGKGYLIGKSSDLNSLLGVGPLVSRIQDILATCGQKDLTLIAVPVQGQAGGYISTPVKVGSGPMPMVTGYPQRNADIVVKVVSEGQIGTATVQISFDDGKTYGTAEASSVNILLGSGEASTGATLVFPDETANLMENTLYKVTVRTSIGPVQQIGEASPSISIEGTVKTGAELEIIIVKGGDLNEGTYKISLDGGDNYSKVRTIPADGTYTLSECGVTLTFPKGKYAGGTVYSCRLLPPEPSIVDVMEALETPLSLYDVEFVHVAGSTDSVDWAAAQAKAEELWNAHRPTYFKMETRLPYDNEDLSAFTAWLLAERQEIAGRFVQVICQYGEVLDTKGGRYLRNFGGLQSGRVLSIPVQRATGRVKDGPISQATLPSQWDSVQSTLEDAGFVTAKKYAGLNGVYWADSRTLAEDTSDYRYEEVLRTAFKAVRKLRIAALKSMYDEAGDPIQGDESSGLAYLKASLENALDTMVKAIPKELAGYIVNIPSGQDIVNNGVAVEVTLIGLPIMREIKIFVNYTYAGSNFDPRLGSVPQ